MTELEKCQLAVDKGFRYDPKTGNIYNKEKLVNTKTDLGYIRFGIRFNKKVYGLYAHRFGWWFVNEKLPENQIDHIDRNRINNEIINLREVTNQENSFNRGAKGYSWHKLSGKYRAYIMINGKLKHLGLYETASEAHEVYLKAKKIDHIF